MTPATSMQIAYRGSTFALGNDGESYCILHTDNHGRTSVMRTFPLSDTGWRDAWTTFVRQEPHHVALGQSETQNLLPPPPAAHPSESTIRERVPRINASVLRGALLTGASAGFIATIATLFSVASISAGYSTQSEPVLLLIALSCLVGGAAFGSLSVALPHAPARARLSLLLGGLAIGLFGPLFTVFASVSAPVATGTFLNSLDGVLAAGSLCIGSLLGAAAVIIWPHYAASGRKEAAHLFLLLALLGVVAGSLFLGYAAAAQDPVVSPFTSTFVDALVGGVSLAVAIATLLLASAWSHPAAKSVGTGTGIAFVIWSAAAILAAVGITYPSTTLTLITALLACIGAAVLTASLFIASHGNLQREQS